MTRDLALTFSVFISIVSIIFGVYKNVEAGNARTFAYAQMYRVMSLVREAKLPSSTRSTLISDVLLSLSVPTSVIDFSQSSASQPTACTQLKRSQCIATMQQYATANKQCGSPTATTSTCQNARQLRDTVMSGSCSSCF